jgi:predicted DNA-binding protein YlxM (UPF0122 family)
MKIEQANAKELFLTTNFSNERIAEIVGVNRKTIYSWIAKYGWQEEKDAQRLTGDNIRRLTNLIGQRYLEALEQKAQDNIVPDKGDIDAVNKLITALNKINQGETLTNYISAHTAFLQFLVLRDVDLAKKVAEHMQEFHKIKAKELS